MGIEDVRVIRDSDMEGRGANKRVISRKGDEEMEEKGRIKGGQVQQGGREEKGGIYNIGRRRWE